jgi:hypothetical protein
MSALRDLLAKATPGPWWADSPGFGTIFRGSSYEDSRQEGDWLFDAVNGSDADAALIVYLVNHAEAIAELIEQADALQDFLEGTAIVPDRGEPIPADRASVVLGVRDALAKFAEPQR